LITRFAPHFLRKLELYPETIIIAASQSGLDVLVTYGQKIFFIDGTHSLLEGKMQLTEIAIKDKFGKSIFLSFIIKFVSFFQTIIILSLFVCLFVHIYVFVVHNIIQKNNRMTTIFVTLVGCGVPCAYMISKEKTSTVYKLFIETINNITHGQWRPEYCKYDFERALHLGSFSTLFHFFLSASFILFNFFFLSSFSRLFLISRLINLISNSLFLFFHFSFLCYILLL